MTETVQPWQVCCLQVARARTGRTPKMSVRELAKRIQSLGFDGPGEERIRQLEAGARPGVTDDVRLRAENIRLREVVALAAGLDVPLVAMLAPVDEDGPFVMFGEIPVPPKPWRSWLHGFAPIGGDLGSWATFYLGPLTTARQRRAIERKAAESGAEKVPASVHLIRMSDEERQTLLAESIASREEDR